MRTIATKTHRDDSSGKMVEIFFVDGGGHLESVCTITKEKRFGAKTFDPARVNWAGWGAQVAATALEFAGAITYAAHAAALIDAELESK